MDIKEFKLEHANEASFEAIHHFLNGMRAESLPDDPPKSLSATRSEFASLEKLEALYIRIWHVWQDNRIVASLLTQLEPEGSNQHLLNMQIAVLPDFRRQGIASELLKFVLDVANEKNRRLVLAVSSSRSPAGKEFAERLGAEAGLSAHTNQLHMQELDREMMQDWVSQSAGTAADFSLGFYSIPLPEQEIEAVVAMMQVMNSQPKDRLDLEERKLSVEQVRMYEAYLKARKAERWLLYARHNAGAYAGYTEVIWDPETPYLMYQGDTGVLPAYRGRGLGKWLKASMVQKILKERPEVNFIRTGNADSNAPMLAINQKMGFKPYRSETVWQLDKQKLKAYLAEKGLD